VFDTCTKLQVTWTEKRALFSASALTVITSVIRYTQIAALVVAEDIEFCKKYGVLPDKDLKDCIHCNKSTVISLSL
jgi:hypothetical protein